MENTLLLHRHTGFRHAISAGIIVGLLLAVVPVLSANTNTKLLKQFRNTYGGITSAEISFSSGVASGTITAVKGKGYRITLPDQEFISDNSTVWQINKRTKTVVINAVSSAGQTASLDQMFFVLMNIYVPSVVSSVPGKACIRLTPPHQSAAIAGVEYANVYLNKKNGITRIVVSDGQHETEWTIRSIKTRVQVKPSAFTFTAPKGWQVIDLR
ncbi:MAG: hypothetical protein D8M52_06520 [Chlorobi bacterium]|nr:MAG: hypothetical protein F9K28_06865 [Bacteroidota bacterium]KXK34072.1 MAG: Outer membrane lipoprotein-sorting protein [Chlorobi bacterium OLB6]MBE2265127.1 outer-membrane lipoprotein carrier protein LolA [Flavobacteriales bacterium]MBL1161356.1 hypothetical protein [Chlorobiota bacterium]MBV6462708.1 hypothetical protein [Chlorobiota bacterium]